MTLRQKFDMVLTATAIEVAGLTAISCTVEPANCWGVFFSLFMAVGVLFTAIEVKPK